MGVFDQYDDHYARAREQLLDLGKRYGAVSPTAWDVWVRVANGPIADDVLWYFGSWNSFIDASGLSRPARVKETKRNVLMQGRRFVRNYGMLPTEWAWKNELGFLAPEAVSRRVKGFERLREILELDMLGKAEFVGAKAMARVGEAHLAGASEEEIAVMEGLPVHKVRLLLRNNDFCPAERIARVKSVEDLDLLSLPGVFRYHKGEWHERIAEVVSTLQEPVRYLGLEGPYFGSLRRIASLGLDATCSCVPEYSPRLYNLMRSVVAHGHLLRGGGCFQGLSLYAGTVEDAIMGVDKTYNVLNFDYQSCIDDTKLRVFANMFRLGRVADDARVFVTLNNHQRNIGRLKKGARSNGPEHSDGFPSTDQGLLCDYYMDAFAKDCGFSVERIFSQEYSRGSGASMTVMLNLAYRVRKV